MYIHPFILALLEQHAGVPSFTAADGYPPYQRNVTAQRLERRWGGVFATESDCVIVALGGNALGTQILAVESIEKLHESLAQLGGGDVEMLLQLPRAIWESIRETPNIGSVIDRSNTGYHAPRQQAELAEEEATQRCVGITG